MYLFMFIATLELTIREYFQQRFLSCLNIYNAIETIPLICDNNIRNYISCFSLEILLC